MGSEYRELVLGAEYSDLLAGPERVAAVEVDMDALGEAMIANLNEQRRAYADYHVAAERQKLALVNNRLAENLAMNGEAEHALSLLSGLETERLGIVERILAARPDLAASPAQLRCEALYPVLDPLIAQKLKLTRLELRKAVDALQRVLAVNFALVENGSRIIHTTIGIITSVVGRSRQDNMSTYTKKGGVNVGKVQIRNLINRSI